MITPSFNLTATERVLPKLALDFTDPILDSRVTFTRTGNTATVVDSTGNFQMVGNDMPRFDYSRSAIGTCLGLLIESERTNLLSYSDFAGAVAGVPGFFPTGWTSTLNNGSVVSVVTDSLGGNVLTFSTTSTRKIMAQTLTIAANTTYQCSIYIHSNSGLPFNDIFLLISAPAGSVGNFYVNGVLKTLSYVPVAGDRLTYELVSGATTGTATLRVGCGVSNSVTGTVSFSKPQVEIGGFPTSYIPNAGSTQNIRSADIAMITGTNFSSWFNAAEGAFLVKATTSEVPSSDGVVRFAAAIYDTNSYVNAIRLERVNGNCRIVKIVAGASALQTFTWDNQTTATILCAYKNNDSATSFNASIPSSIVGSVPFGVAQMGIGGNDFGGNSWCGHIQAIRYWPQRLINAEIQAFSK